MGTWVLDLVDQKSDVEGEIWQLKQELKRKKEELAQLEARKRELEASGLNNAGPVVSSSVSVDTNIYAKKCTAYHYSPKNHSKRAPAEL